MSSIAHGQQNTATTGHLSVLKPLNLFPPPDQSNYTWRNRSLPSPPQINLSVSVCPSVIPLLSFLRKIAQIQQIW